MKTRDYREISVTILSFYSALDNQLYSSSSDYCYGTKKINALSFSYSLDEAFRSVSGLPIGKSVYLDLGDL